MKAGAVAAGHRLTANAAAEVLKDGGNAFDAVIAGLWMACLCEPVLASPGGGGFVMARAAMPGKAHLFDFFAQTPHRKPPLEEVEFAAVLADFGPTTQEFHIGAGASAVPGFVPGLFALHEALGSVPMARLAEPAVAAAREGIEITPFQAHLFSVVAPILTWTEEARALFAPGGVMLEAGAKFTNPALGDAIDVITREGMRIATEGEIAEAMIASTDGGALGAKDLAAYAPQVRAPLGVEFEERRLSLNPRPSCGGTLIARMLAELEAERVAKTPAGRLAAAMARTDLAWRDAGGDMGAFTGEDGPPSGGTSRRGTTHISVVDGKGNAAAATVSNGEGNGRLSPGCGFMVNNMLGESDINPGGFYRWEPDRRLASMMAPTLMLAPDGAIKALGTGGSNRIRTAIFQTIARLVDHAGELEALVETPRLHVEDGHLDFEDQFGEEERAELTAAFASHRAWATRNLFYGGVHVARRDAKGTLSAAGDPRRGGAAFVV